MFEVIADFRDFIDSSVLFQNRPPKMRKKTKTDFWSEGELERFFRDKCLENKQLLRASPPGKQSAAGGHERGTNRLRLQTGFLSPATPAIN